VSCTGAGRQVPDPARQRRRRPERDHDGHGRARSDLDDREELVMRWAGARWVARSVARTRAARALIALCVSGVSGASATGTSRFAWVPEAHAEDVERDAAGSVIVGGGAEDHDRRVVGAAVAVAAREAGWSLPREPVTKQDADRLLDCGDRGTPWACIPASLGGRGIRRIFAFAVERNQSDSGAPMVVLTARLIVTAPQALVVRQRFCEHCADDRLTEASIELARQLLQDLAVRSGRTILEVAS